MKKLSLFVLILISAASLSCGGGGKSAAPVTPSLNGQTAGYVLTAWSELGMHCIDGKDYSVMSILPPYNTVHAQLVKQAEPPQIVTSGVTITYEAVADTNGSVNTGSATKTNFWTWVSSLFLANPAPDMGLAGNAVQSNTPHPLAFNQAQNWWEAIGIPTIPYDDNNNLNVYPMVRVVARDAQGKQLAEAKIVLNVSDEISCDKCHSSGSDAAAQPAAGWEKNPDLGKDTRLNILKRHDDEHNISAFLPALAAKGYTYQSSLYQTAIAGTPILCAACHATNALGAVGLPGIKPVTEAMHSMHSGQINPATGATLDKATTPQDSCYLCHPGVQTKCQRGAMRGIACFDCHGNLSAVGTNGRRGWLDEPNCQMCHNNNNPTRGKTTFASPGVLRTTTDSTFATTPDVPVKGASLFRFSTGHGSLHCNACHGAPHAEFPTSQPNDNVYSTALQNYPGKIVECAVCHTSTPSGALGGPHNLHAVGQSWVNGHQQAAKADTTQCTYCHGADFRGTFLSRTNTTRAFDMKTYPTGTPVGCYDCHGGPNG